MRDHSKPITDGTAAVESSPIAHGNSPRTSSRDTEAVPLQEVRLNHEQSDDLPWPNEEPIKAEVASSSSSSPDDIEAALNESRQKMLDSEALMKARLKTKFCLDEWNKTLRLRQSEMEKGWMAVSLKSHWPFLFQEKGVI